MKSAKNKSAQDIKVLAVSTYELGHQPLVLARLASILDIHGIEYSLVDNSVANRSFESPDDFTLAGGQAPTHLILSVPMHTATQLGKKIAERAKALFGSKLTVIALGMYSKVALSTGTHFDAGIATLDLQSVSGALGIESAEQPHTEKLIPNRSSLPSISNYAYLVTENGKRLVGYVESTVGCAHSCKHCPVPVIYHGRFKAIPSQLVLSEIDDLVRKGSEHITFGDPDFLNGPAHALKIIREMHQRHPELTFDATIKVEHVLEHPDIWDEMSQAGLQFIVSAFEHTSDYILKKLDKGHTKADIINALTILRKSGIEVRPSLLPFTPWTDRDNLLELIEFIFEYDLIQSIDPVQLGIKLLVPLDSLLLSDQEVDFGPWDPDLLSFQWHNRNRTIDELQTILSAIAQESETTQKDPLQTFHEMREAAYSHFGAKAPEINIISSAIGPKPHLSESWFCCAEPTEQQLGTFDSDQGCKPSLLS